MSDIKVGDYVRAWITTARRVEGTVISVSGDGTVSLDSLQNFREGTVEYGPDTVNTVIDVVDNRRPGDIWGADNRVLVYQGDDTWSDPVLHETGKTIDMVGSTWADIPDAVLVYRQGVTNK